MIKSNELRVGNWGMQGGEPYLFDLGEKIDDFSDITHPILLTPDILLKCGFNRAAYSNNDFLLGWFRLTHVHLTENYCFALYDRNPLSIKYLHQLQNLYFVLNGIELSVNIETSIQYEKS